MAAAFPDSLPSFTSKTDGQTIEEEHINDPQEEIVAIATKVGIDDDSNPDSLDYHIHSGSSLDSGHKHSIATISGDIPEGRVSRAGSPIHARLSENEVVSGSWAFPDATFTSGYGALPTANNRLRIGAGGSSPNSVSVVWGDGSGKAMVFGTNVGGVFTPTHAFYDQGDARIGKKLRVGSIAPALGLLNIAASNGTPGSAQLLFDAGTLLGIPISGCMEYDGEDLYFTTAGGVRDKLTNVNLSADGIAYDPAGQANLSATDVQAAITEIHNEWLHKSGGVLTGALTLNADPTANLGAATKQYVDSLRANLLGTVNVKNIATTSTTPVTMLDSTPTYNVPHGKMLEFEIGGEGYVSRASFSGVANMYVCFELWEGSPLSVKARWLTQVPIVWDGAATTVYARVPSPRFRVSFAPGSHTFDIRVFVSNALYTYQSPRSGSNNSNLTVVDW